MNSKRKFRKTKLLVYVITKRSQDHLILRKEIISIQHIGENLKIFMLEDQLSQKLKEMEV